MSRAIEEAEIFRDWLASYDSRQASELMEIVGRMMASLPGGESFEGIGYEPYDSVSWHEFKLIHDLYVAVEDSSDVEAVFGVFFEDEDEDEDDY